MVTVTPLIVVLKTKKNKIKILSFFLIIMKTYGKFVPVIVNVVPPPVPPRVGVTDVTVAVKLAW